MTELIITTGDLAYTSAAKPNKRLGSAAKVPIDADAREVYLWFPHREIPSDATITSAHLELGCHGDWPGTRDLTAAACLDKWDPDTLTWNIGEGIATSASDDATATVGGDDKDVMTIPGLGDMVQAWVNGERRNRGLRLTTDDTTRRYLRGFTANNPKPRLVVNYEVPAGEPWDLKPNGAAVSVAKPELTFSVPRDTTHIQVQVATDEDFTAVVHDSGEVPRTVGVYALTSTAYAGLALDASMYWRARVRTGAGLGGWVTATTTRIAKVVGVIDSPGPVTANPTPPIVWTAEGQVEARVQVRVGDKIEDSGWLPFVEEIDGSYSYTPELAPTEDGTATAQVHIIDDVDRVATKDDPVHSTVSVTYQLNYAVGLPVATVLEVTQRPDAPWQLLRWHCAETPDEWAIDRDGRQIALFDGAEAGGGDDVFEWWDYGAAPGRRHTWRVRAVVDGQVSAEGPTAQQIPHISGIWIVNPETGVDVRLIGNEEPNVELTEVTVIHEPLDADPVIRTFSQRGLAGDAAGELHSVGGRSSDADYATLLQMRADSARGVVHQVAWASHNIPAALHSVSPVGKRGIATPGEPRRRVKLGLIQRPFRVEDL